MRKITKGDEPEALLAWKRRNTSSVYEDLEGEERRAIRTACLQEQFFLCAYCSQSIGERDGDCTNEHIEARRTTPNRALDFSNIVVSCKTPRQCDQAHGHEELPLTPLMNECETEFVFKLSGRVEGLTDRARRTIEVLNLGDREVNNRSLIQKRKQLSDALLFSNGIHPREGLEDDELLQMVIDDLVEPIDGKLESFSPVAVSILKGWLPD